MARLDLDANRLVLSVSPLQHDLARQVPGLAYHRGEDVWTGIAAWSTALACHGLFLDDLQLGPDAHEWWTWNTQREAVAEGLKVWMPDPVPTWAADLRPLQRTGVGFLTGNRRALLADDPGAGKGVMVATALGLLPADAFPALIICPKSVKWTHARHLDRWGGEAKAFVVQGDVRARRATIEEALAFEGKAVLVMNYEQVREHSALAPYGSVQRTEKEKTPKELNAAGLRTVVVDEAHRVKDPKGKTTRAVWSLTHPAERVWATTATPIPDPIGFWSLMHTITPREAPSRVKFQDRYCLTESIYAKGGREVSVVRAFNPRTQAELDRWVAPYLMRRSIDQIEPDLPPLEYRTLWVEMEGKQAAAYKSMKKAMVAEVPSGIIAATDPMQQSLRLLQLASALPVFEEVEVEEETRLRLVEFTAPSNKVTAVMDWLEDHDGQLVVFAASRRLIELLARALEKEGHTHGLITGSQSEQARGLAEADFMSGDLRVLAGTYGAMSEGITLTAASVQMHLQRSFKLIENVQADGRTRRIGQTADHVEIIDVVSVNSYDEAVFESGAYKEETAQALLKDPAWIRRALEGRC